MKIKRVFEYMILNISLSNDDVENIMDVFQMYFCDVYHMIDLKNDSYGYYQNTDKQKTFFSYSKIDRDKILDITIYKGDSIEPWGFNQQIGLFVKRLDKLGYVANGVNHRGDPKLYTLRIYKNEN